MSNIMNRKDYLEKAEIPSLSQPARIRVLHASPNIEQVDIYLNGIRIIKDFLYKEISNYLYLPHGKYQIDIYPAGKMVSTFLSRTVIIEAGKLYTFAAAGDVKNMRLTAFEDNPSVPSGETKFRFLHLSPDAPAFDVAVKKGDVVFPSVSFRKSSSYLGLSPMTVNLEARIAGTSNIALPLPGVQFKQDETYSIIIIGSGPELEAIMILG